jgi:hypothetical protein
MDNVDIARFHSIDLSLLENAIEEVASNRSNLEEQMEGYRARLSVIEVESSDDSLVSKCEDAIESLFVAQESLKRALKVLERSCDRVNSHKGEQPADPLR